MTCSSLYAETIKVTAGRFVCRWAPLRAADGRNRQRSHRTAGYPTYAYTMASTDTQNTASSIIGSTGSRASPQQLLDSLYSAHVLDQVRQVVREAKASYL